MGCNSHEKFPNKYIGNPPLHTTPTYVGYVNGCVDVSGIQHKSMRSVSVCVANFFGFFLYVYF